MKCPATGRKPCIILPMVGAFISNCFNFVNYTWILPLPTEFFYLCGLFWFNILGGTGVFCLGYYGYGASISTEETRTRVLGKSDQGQNILSKNCAIKAPSFGWEKNYHGLFRDCISIFKDFFCQI